MKVSDISMSQLPQPSTNVVGPGFITFQLSYSTADVEKSVFVGEVYEPLSPAPAIGPAATILVVHGDMYFLEDRPLPQPATPLTPGSGLFRIGANQQP